MLERKRWSGLVGKAQCLHLAIIPFTRERPSRYHTHDFPEVFWIERGQALHRINGQERMLQAGDVVFVRPEDQHVLSAVDARGFTLVNLAYDPCVRKALLARHGTEMTALFAPTGKFPYQTRCALPTRTELTRLSSAPDSQIALEHFLLGLALQAQPAANASPAGLPDWLQHACEEIQRPERMAQGVPGLVRAAGRSSEHVARVVRQSLGVTPSDYLNRVRMEYAGRELRMTDRAIADIALDCGLNNLSHFYALFKKAHGQTPRRYRRRQTLAV